MKTVKPLGLTHNSHITVAYILLLVLLCKYHHHAQNQPQPALCRPRCEVVTNHVEEKIPEDFSVIFSKLNQNLDVHHQILPIKPLVCHLFPHPNNNLALEKVVVCMLNETVNLLYLKMLSSSMAHRGTTGPSIIFKLNLYFKRFAPVCMSLHFRLSVFTAIFLSPSAASFYFH